MKLAIETLLWSEARNNLVDLNPELVAIIDSISPDDSYKLTKARYQFGDAMLTQTKLHLPCVGGGTIPYDNESVPLSLQKELGYNFGANPVAILLNKSAELYISLADRIIPYALASPGKIIGAWRVLDDSVSHCPATFLWGMTAGARSIFMLPKISKQVAHQRLKREFNIEVDKPKNITDHWHVFKALNKSKSFQSEWHVDVLYFNAKWFEMLRDIAWSAFHKYLLDSVWKGGSFWRNQYVWETLLAHIRFQKGLLPSPQVTDLVKHLFTIGVGVVPGFQPALSDNLAPVENLQKIYTDCYNLGEYAPIIMQPSYFSFYDKTAPVYYSLQYPTALELSPKSSKHSTTLSDLYDTGSLLGKYLQELDPEKLHLETTPLGNLSKHVDYDLFHSNTGPYQHIRSCSHVPKEDDNFLGPWINTENCLFPPNSTFFNGCIRISNKPAKKI